MNNNKVKLVTSNINKLKEYKEFGLKNIEIELGRDLKEVDGSKLDVIIYKALEAGKDRLVEDTSLDVEGKDIGVNIRWMLNELNKINNKKAIWTVMLGYNDGAYIKVYMGILEGVIKQPKFKVSKDAFGFDPYFVPTENNIDELPLSMLDKNKYSARKIAIENFLKDNYIKKVKIETIPKWKGKYQ